MKKTVSESLATDQTHPFDIELANEPRQKVQEEASSESHLEEPESVILARVYEFILSWPEQDGDSETTEPTPPSGDDQVSISLDDPPLT